MESEGEVVVLPRAVAAWVRELLGGEIPAESAAVCEPCAMCAPQPSSAHQGFDPKTKCCTFHPSLPNFVVGGVLADSDPLAVAGREIVARRVREGVGVTPLALRKPERYRLLWRHGEAGYGRSEELACPYFLRDRGGCGIWAHREATCATWFCKHDRGAVGRHFWLALQSALATVERSLSLWCALELEIEPDALAQVVATSDRMELDAAQLDLVPDPTAQRALWGEWYGREEAFYEECRLRVEPLAWGDVLALGGVELRARVDVLRRAYRDLIEPKLPNRLELGTWQVLACSEETVDVVGYSSYDALALPRPVLELLRFFDGRPVQAALDAIPETGWELDEELLQMLVDFELLRSAATPSSGRPWRGESPP